MLRVITAHGGIAYWTHEDDAVKFHVTPSGGLEIYAENIHHAVIQLAAYAPGQWLRVESLDANH